MPTLVIHEMGKPAKKSTLKAKKIRVGRDTKTCDIVLPSDTVSREHALFSHIAGRWNIACLSDTNPLVVDGALIEETALVTEGSEILVGTETLLIFSEDAYKAESYMGEKTYFAKSECGTCHWKGMVCTLRRKPVCPKCGGLNLISETEYSRDDASRGASQGATTAARPAELKAMLNKLKAAKRSRLERIGDHDGPSTKDLTEGKIFRIGKSEDDDFQMSGFSWGKGAVISWIGSQYVVESKMVFPSLKVNGSSTKRSRLKDGDLVEIGSNRFRFVTE